MKSYILKIVLVCVLGYCCFSAQGQQYIYRQGNRMYYSCDSTSAIVIVAGDTNALQRVAFRLDSIFNGNKDLVSFNNEDDVIFLHSDNLPSVVPANMINVISHGGQDSISFFSYAKIVNECRLWFRNELLIELKESITIQDIDSFIQHFNVKHIEHDTLNEYVLFFNSEQDMVNLANCLYESKKVIYSAPDYYGGFQMHSIPPVDPRFPHQYYLYNSGQIIPNVISSNEWGMPNIDIKAIPVWNFMLQIRNDLGDDIRVAVIDDGVEDHADLRTGSIHRVLEGWTCRGGDGSPMDKCKHGQCVAGIIAAEHNNIGIAGIAPKTMIIPIRIQKDHAFTHWGINGIYQSCFFSQGKIARAIRKSWKKFNSDVLNCSWGGFDTHDIVLRAITKATQKGRDYKGCVVVASAGNESLSTAISDISALDNVISVGAIDKNGVHQEYSNYTSSSNAGISVVAFGGRYDHVSSSIEGCDIRTVDRTGTRGYSTGDYNDYFGQTSAAAPMVSGVASLMLSVNPNLTSQQVKNIIEQTAQKLPDYTFTPANTIHPNGSWNEQVGYGLVDAHKAVVYALEYGHDAFIIGNNALSNCNNNVFTCDVLHPELFTYSWSATPNLSIVGSTNHSVSVIPVNTGTGTLTVEVYQQGRLMFTREKTIDILSICTTAPPVSSTLVEINTDTLWTSPVFLPIAVVVDSLATLTITDTVYCSPVSRIIVRPGGKLIVNGGTLTSACAGEMWQGVYVEGHRDQPQTAANQGTVQLLNGAVIENAFRGIYTGAPGDNWATTGGIITADSATFRNCAKAVDYLPFVAHNNIGYVTDNWGSFNNCTFTVDNNNLFAANNTDFLAHVTMWDVKGVRFTHCRFEDVRTGFHTRKSAISTIDAGFKIKNGCDYTLPLSNPDCNCYLTTNTYCSFSGFGTAISAATSGNPYAVTIDGARFIDNVTGVGISGNSHAEVTRCIFHLDSIIPDYRSVTGLSLSGCTGYLVEENTFTRVATSPSGNRYGIQVVASGTDMNSLYRNTFERLTRGITVSGINGDGDSHTGLQMTCNGFTSNTYDMYIASGATVCDNQGSTSKGADNTFSGTQTSSLYSAGSQSLTYHHSAGSSHAPYNPTTNYVTVNGTAGSNMCGSTICGIQPDIPTPPPVPKSPTPGFLSLKEQYNNLMADFNRNGYAEVLEHADDNTYDAATIAAAENAAQQISTMAAELYAQSHAAVRALIADSLEDVQAVHAWLDATPGLVSRYLAVETGFVAEPVMGTNTMVGTRLIASLQDVATQITTSAERDEYDNYVAFQALKDALSYGNGHVAWPHATDAQVWELVRIADANTGRSSLLAKNVLCFFFGICYDDDMETRALTTTTIPPQAEPTTLTSQQRITVHPNPTHDMLRVAVTEGDADIARVEMFDMFGRAIRNSEFKIQNSNTQHFTIDMSAIPSGVYVLRVTLTDGAVRTVKVVKD